MFCFLFLTIGSIDILVHHLFHLVSLVGLHSLHFFLWIRPYFLWITLYGLLSLDYFLLTSCWVSFVGVFLSFGFILFISFSSFLCVNEIERWYYRSMDACSPPLSVLSVPDRGGVYVCTMHESVSVYVCVRKTMYHRERERVIWEMYDCMCVFVREIMRHRRYYVHDCYIWCMWMWCYVYDCMCNRDGERCECACVLWMLMWTWHHVVYLYVCERDSVA